MDNELLKVENVTVAFDDFKALDDVSIAAPLGGVQVVIGPNGAGKSTLMDTIIGRVHPISGRILFKGEDVTRLPEYQIVRRGICRKFQTPGILPTLTVEQNIMVAGKHHRGCRWSFRSSLSNAERYHVNEILDLIDLRSKSRMLAGHLAHGAKQWLEIGMVVSSNADLLLLDEPAAGMTQQERSKTAELVKNLGRNHSLIVIDHDMDFVEQLEAPVSVLHMGRMLRQGSIHEVRSDAQVQSVYLGRVEEVSVVKA